MPEIQIPFPLQAIPIKPELKGKVKIDDTVIQTIAALCGWNGEARRLLTCAVGGSLNTVSPKVAGVTNKVTTGDNEHITFSDVKTTEVIIIAPAANAGDVWANVYEAAGVDTGVSLDAGEYVQWSIDNMRDLRLFVTTTGDKVIIVRTV